MLSETGLIGGRTVLRNIIPRGDSVVLRMMHFWVHNSFQTLAVVKLQPGAHGTRIKVTLRSYYFTAAFMTLWLGLVLLFNLFVLGAVVSGAGHFEDLGFTLVFLAAGFGFVAFGRLLTRPDAPALLAFIRSTTDAQDMPPGLEPSS